MQLIRRKSSTNTSNKLPTNKPEPHVSRNPFSQNLKNIYPETTDETQKQSNMKHVERTDVIQDKESKSNDSPAISITSSNQSNQSSVPEHEPPQILFPTANPIYTKGKKHIVGDKNSPCWLVTKANPQIVPGKEPSSPIKEESQVVRRMRSKKTLGRINSLGAIDEEKEKKGLSRMKSFQDIRRMREKEDADEELRIQQEEKEREMKEQARHIEVKKRKVVPLKDLAKGKGKQKQVSLEEAEENRRVTRAMRKSVGDDHGDAVRKVGKARR
jgi:hypothetical protein